MSNSEDLEVYGFDSEYMHFDQKTKTLNWDKTKIKRKNRFEEKYFMPNRIVSLELEDEYRIQRNTDLLCPVVNHYSSHVMSLTEHDDILAHIYVRHFGDMYGGQMIRKRQPGSGKMYDFIDVEDLKTTVRAKLKDSMADEANRCFVFAMQLFEELGE